MIIRSQISHREQNKTVREQNKHDINEFNKMNNKISGLNSLQVSQRTQRKYTEKRMYRKKNEQKKDGQEKKWTVMCTQIIYRLIYRIIYRMVFYSYQ